MTPEDLVAVRASWTQLRTRRAAFAEALARALTGRLGAAAPTHAGRLLAATDQLVDLLPTPSALADRVAAIVASWGPDAPAPDLDHDGVAWRVAAAAVDPTWSTGAERAWRRTWLLLGDVVAADTLAPFGDPLRTPDLPT